MKINFLILFLSLFYFPQLFSETSYHFNEEFASSSITGWMSHTDAEVSGRHSNMINPQASVLDNYVESFVTDFGDGSWGTPLSSAPTSGSYPSSTVNGFNLIKAVLLTGSVTCQTGEKHINRILVDKSSRGGMLEFPTLKTVGEIVIHATTGTKDMSFRLEEWVDDRWQLLEIYTTRTSPDSIYNIPLERNTATRLRIANNTGSGFYVYKVVTRTYQETIDLTLRSSSPGEGEVCFYNLKKQITLNFNKEVMLGSGTLKLNGVSIPLNSSIITGDVVLIPVQLEGIPAVNKSYTFTASAGCFVEKNIATKLSKAIVVNFQTFKTVDYPVNYASQIDVVYKEVNSPNTRMDIYYPTNPKKPVPVIISMHGGGWNHGSKEEQTGFNTYFNQGYAVANVEYRLTGEAKAPAAVQDVRAAMLYILHHAEALNIDKNKIIFIGGSSASHLALTAGYLQNNRMHDTDTAPYAEEIKVLAVIAKYGPAKLSDLMSYASLLNWLGDNASNVDFIRTVSPVDLIDANTPPTYIIHGDADPVIPYSQSVALHTALKDASIKHKFTTVPGGGHGGFSTAYNTQMIDEINQFISEAIAEQEASVGINSIHEPNVRFVVEKNKIIILSEDFIKATLYDSNGKQVLITNQKILNVNNKGLYFIKFQMIYGNFIQKVLML